MRDPFIFRHYVALAALLSVSAVLGVAGAIALWLTVLPMVEPIAQAFTAIGGVL